MSRSDFSILLVGKKSVSLLFFCWFSLSLSIISLINFYQSISLSLYNLFIYSYIQGVSKRNQPFLSWISPRWFGQINWPFRRLFVIAKQISHQTIFGLSIALPFKTSSNMLWLWRRDNKTDLILSIYLSFPLILSFFLFHAFLVFLL